MDPGDPDAGPLDVLRETTAALGRVQDRLDALADAEKENRRLITRGRHLIWLLIAALAVVSAGAATAIAAVQADTASAEAAAAMAQDHRLCLSGNAFRAADYLLSDFALSGPPWQETSASRAYAGVTKAKAREVFALRDCSRLTGGS